MWDTNAIPVRIASTRFTQKMRRAAPTEEGRRPLHGAAAGFASAEYGAAGAAGAAANTIITGGNTTDPHLANNELKQQEKVKKQQTYVSAESHNTYEVQLQSAVDNEQTVSTSAAGKDQPVFRDEDLLNSQASVDVEDMEYDTGSDTVSVGDTSLKNPDLYSLEEINQFLDETYKKICKSN